MGRDTKLSSRDPRGVTIGRSTRNSNPVIILSAGDAKGS